LRHAVLRRHIRREQRPICGQDHPNRIKCSIKNKQNVTYTGLTVVGVNHFTISKIRKIYCIIDTPMIFHITYRLARQMKRDGARIALHVRTSARPTGCASLKIGSCKGSHLRRLESMAVRGGVGVVRDTEADAFASCESPGQPATVATTPIVGKTEKGIGCARSIFWDSMSQL
jgi:hypothetical protein